MRQTSACCVVYSSVNLFEANLSPEFQAPFSRIIRDDEGESQQEGKQAASETFYCYFNIFSAQHSIK